MESKDRLIIDLAKAGDGKLDTSGLVQRPTPYKGKDGKMHIRMQWVDPNKDKTSPKSAKRESADDLEIPGIELEDDIGEITEINEEEEDNQPQLEIDVPADLPEDVVIDRDHLEAAVLSYVQDLDKDARFDLIDEYRIEWDQVEHPLVNNMKAIAALKEYLMNHPQLVPGAMDLPTKEEISPQFTREEDVNEFYDKTSKDTAELYKAMEELGIGNGVDPRDPKKPATNIQHMRNVTAFKTALMEDYEAFKRISEDDRWKEKEPETPTKTKTKAEKGKKDINSIVEQMSTNDIFQLSKKLGITEVDPKDWTPQERVAYLNKIKMKCILDSSILSEQFHNNQPSDEQQAINAETISEDDILTSRVNDFYDKITRDRFEELYEEYDSSPEFDDLVEGDNESINHMNRVKAFKKFLKNNPDVMDLNADLVEEGYLASAKITNKQLERVIQTLFELPGLGEVKIEDKDEETGRTTEWSFHNNEMNFVMIQQDEDDEWVLDITLTDDLTLEEDIHSKPLSEVLEFLADYDSNGKRIAEELPLHEKDIGTILKSINDDFDKHYNKKLNKKLGSVILPSFINACTPGINGTGYGSVDLKVSSIMKNSGLTTESFKKLMDKWEVRIDEYSDGEYITINPEFKRNVWGNRITETKEFNAREYIFPNGNGTYDTYALVESAKNWSQGERTTARKEIIRAHMTVEHSEHEFVNDPAYNELAFHRTSSVIEEVTHSMPFDLFSDVTSVVPLEFVFGGEQFEGDRQSDYSFSRKGNQRIDFPYAPLGKDSYWNSLGVSLTSDNFGQRNGLEYAAEYQDSLAAAVANGMAHAVDRMFQNMAGRVSNDKTNGHWKSAIARKYAPDYMGTDNPIAESYTKAVNESNPEHYIMVENDTIYHLGNFIDAEEGFINTRQDLDEPGFNVKEFEDETTMVYDNRFQSEAKSGKTGKEHWARNVERYLMAMFSSSQVRLPYEDFDDYLDADQIVTYEEGKESGEVLEWSQNHLPDDLTHMINEIRDDYSLSREYNPLLTEAIESIFNRPDFDNDGELSAFEKSRENVKLVPSNEEIIARNEAKQIAKEEKRIAKEKADEEKRIAKEEKKLAKEKAKAEKKVEKSIRFTVPLEPEPHEMILTIGGERYA